MRDDFAYGVDLGWVSQLEAEGYSWVGQDGNPIDPLEACKELGADSVRLRIFVNPPESAYWMKRETERVMLGYCDPQSVVDFSKRIKAAGMRLMIGFHYSDHFADPEIQDIPDAWADATDDELVELVYGHTKEVMTMFKEADIFPEWVQVGNEINNGIMWPRAGREDNPALLVRCLNAGYKAVKEISPESQVITHLAGSQMDDWCLPFIEVFLEQKGITDIMGFSYYPYWAKLPSDKAQLQSQLEKFGAMVGKPVMVVEVGEIDHNVEESYATVTDALEAVAALPDGLGVFFWEPEVSQDMLPDSYPLGAARMVGEKTMQLTKALSTYKDHQ